MVVMVLERVTPSLRGEITRWMIEPKSGVFVANLSALVRDKLWEMACKKSNDGGCIMIYSSNTEQGYHIRMWGKTNRSVQDFEGLLLIKKSKIEE